MFDKDLHKKHFQVGDFCFFSVADEGLDKLWSGKKINEFHNDEKSRLKLMKLSGEKGSFHRDIIILI